MFNAPGALLVARTLTDTGDRRPRVPRARASWRPAGARALTARRWRPVSAIRVARAQRT